MVMNQLVYCIAMVVYRPYKFGPSNIITVISNILLAVIIGFYWYFYHYSGTLTEPELNSVAKWGSYIAISLVTIEMINFVTAFIGGIIVAKREAKLAKLLEEQEKNKDKKLKEKKETSKDSKDKSSIKSLELMSSINYDSSKS